MATLHSEDLQFETYFELVPGEVVSSKDGERWQVCSIELVQGKRQLHFWNTASTRESGTKTGSKAHPAAAGSKIELADGSFLERHPEDPGQNGYLLCREPKDELVRLVGALKKLAAKEIDKVRFEPVEPSFELEIVRQPEDGGLKAYFWVDAGNVETEIARWDAFGLRFFTSQSHLEQFIEALQKEFGC